MTEHEPAPPRKVPHLTLLKRNIIASYAGQIYVTLIGIATVPMYVRYMGAEAYGLIGFYTMLQGWFMLLDMGLTPTMARETARFRASTVEAANLRGLLRTLEWIFIAIALLGSAAMAAGSSVIAGHWLKVQQLPVQEVQRALRLIGIIIALRWVSELYRGTITGFERLVWLNAINMVIATLRFVLVIPVLIYAGALPTQFFAYQLAVALCEVTVLAGMTYRLMPKSGHSQNVRAAWRSLRGVLHFSLVIAFASLVWVASTQTDKLILSRLLPLSEYAYFTLAVLVASGVVVISVPISGALMPRMVTLNAGGDEASLIRLYRDATQMTAVIVVPTTLVLALFSEQVLWAWTGNMEIARKAAPVLTLYALGNGLMALCSFPYYLQYAKGDLKLHLIGNVLFVVLLIPFLIWATLRYGATGAGYAWLGANVVYFLLWVPAVHHRFVRGLHQRWLVNDLGGILLATGVSAVPIRLWVSVPADRVSAAIVTLLCGSALLVISGAASPWVREMILGRLRARDLVREVL